MAIAFDAVTPNTGLGTRTFSHTCTGSNLILLVGVTWDNTSAVTGITYAGAGLTKAVGLEAYSDRNSEIWFLINPATGANNVVVTGMGASSRIICGAISFTGVKQTLPIGATVSGNVDSTTGITTNITTQADNSWLFDTLGYEGTTGDPVVANGQTSRWDVTDAGGDDGDGSTKPTTTAGNNSMGYTWSALYAQEGVHVVVEIKEAVAFTSGAAAVNMIIVNA